MKCRNKTVIDECGTHRFAVFQATTFESDVVPYGRHCCTYGAILCHLRIKIQLAGDILRHHLRTKQKRKAKAATLATDTGSAVTLSLLDLR